MYKNYMLFFNKKSHASYFILILFLLLTVIFSTSLTTISFSDTDYGNPHCADLPHFHSISDDGVKINICQGDATYTLAQATSGLISIANIINILIGIVVSLAFLYFFWNLAKYIRDENENDEAKKRMGWAVLAIVVITSLWGIVAFVRNVVGVKEGVAGTISLPNVTDYESKTVFEFEENTSTGGSNTGNANSSYNNNCYQPIDSGRCERIAGKQQTRCKDSTKCHTRNECENSCTHLLLTGQDCSSGVASTTAPINCR